MNKIQSFFQNKITKIVSWIILAIVSVILIISGATVENISSGVALVAGIVTAISALIAFISSMIKK